MTFEPRCLATGIGSLPHDDLERALALVAETMPELPYLPQLPALSWHEGMMVQYTEGLPGRVLDEEAGKLHVDTAERGPAELEEFYGRVIAGDPAAFPISEDHWHALGRLDDLLARTPDRLAAKVQVTGPVTQGLSTVDQDKRALYYDEPFQEVIVAGCAGKARWLLARLGGGTRLCFLDEPILSGFGSSVYVSVRREDVVAQLSAVGDAIRADGGLCGVHCCGNTDWSLLTEAGVDVLSFDAFEFSYSLPLYPQAITGFLERGGVIAWGVVPTSEAVFEHDADTLCARLDEALAGVEVLGVPRETLLRQALITPACGFGTATVEVAERALTLLHEVSARFRELA